MGKLVCRTRFPLTHLRSVTRLLTARRVQLRHPQEMAINGDDRQRASEQHRRRPLRFPGGPVENRGSHVKGVSVSVR